MLRIFLVALAALSTVAPALAHPHVWVTMRTELVYAPDGRITGIRHAWSFDDMFSTFAVQGLESKEKGKFTREELAPLAERFGPRVDDVMEGLDVVPDGAASMAFRQHAPANV